MLEEARSTAVEAIKVTQDEQARFWKFLEIDVHAADREVNGRQYQLIWAKIEELANKNAYPLWMDAILMSITALVPVNAIVAAIGARIGRSLKLVKLTEFKYSTAAGIRQPEKMYLKNASQLGVIMRSEPRATPFGTADRLSHQELYSWIDAGTTLQPEMVAGLRNLIRLGATAAARPLFSSAAVEDPKKAAAAEGASLPAVAVFKGMLQWVEISRASDQHVLSLLRERAELSADEKWLQSVPEYLEQGTGRKAPNFRDLPPEWFQRFVEACLWCTTFDFTPTFEPGTPAKTIRYRNEPYDVPARPPTSVVLRFPEEFWKNLVARHYDPFVGKGDRTYKEVGGFALATPTDSYIPPTPLAAELLESGRSEFDARTRLSMHWSGILAPALLNANQAVTTALSSYLRL